MATLPHDLEAHDPARVTATEECVRLAAALAAGDEVAFAVLVDRHHAALLRLARLYVPDACAAEEVVRDAWRALLSGIARYDARAPLKLWLFRLLLEQARTHRAGGVRRGLLQRLLGRTPAPVDIPFARGWDLAAAPPSPALPPHRFVEAGTDAGAWAVPPRPWQAEQQAAGVARQAVEALPGAEREVITLRDLEGWSAAEVGALLDIDSAAQRLLLHRARAAVHRAIEQSMEEQAGDG